MRTYGQVIVDDHQIDELLKPLQIAQLPQRALILAVVRRVGFDLPRDVVIESHRKRIFGCRNLADDLRSDGSDAGQKRHADDFKHAVEMGIALRKKSTKIGDDVQAHEVSDREGRGSFGLLFVYSRFVDSILLNRAELFRAKLLSARMCVRKSMRRGR